MNPVDAQWERLDQEVEALKARDAARPLTPLEQERITLWEMYSKSEKRCMARGTMLKSLFIDNAGPEELAEVHATGLDDKRATINTRKIILKDFEAAFRQKQAELRAANETDLKVIKNGITRKIPVPKSCFY